MDDLSNDELDALDVAAERADEEYAIDPETVETLVAMARRTGEAKEFLAYFGAGSFKEALDKQSSAGYHIKALEAELVNQAASGIKAAKVQADLYMKLAAEVERLEAEVGAKARRLPVITDLAQGMRRGE